MLGEILVEMNKITSEYLAGLLKKLKKASKTEKIKANPLVEERDKPLFSTKEACPRESITITSIGLVVSKTAENEFTPFFGYSEW